MPSAHRLADCSACAMTSLSCWAMKMRMGATHFLMKRLPKVATEMALHVLAYNLTRVMNIMGVKPLIAGVRA